MGQTSAFANLTTVISLLAGVIFLGEPFGWVQLAASVVIVIGVWGVQRQPEETAAVQKEQSL